MPVVREVSPAEFDAQRRSGSNALLLDVREAWELGIASIDGSLHIPMAEVGQRLAELDPARETVVLCRSGGRSRAVAQYLQQQGFAVANLAGGILAWSREVDPRVPEY